MGWWTELKSSGWKYPTTVLSLYGFLANCRVAEPFLTPYLIGPHKNISGDVVTNYLFPIWTYSYLAFLLPVFLLTDFLRYKPLIVLQGLFLVTNYILLCFAPGLPAMTLLQINYAVVTSTEVGYFSYIYSVIPVEKYQRATGYLRSAMLAGYTFGASLGQVLVSLAGLDYFYINTITLGIVSMAFLVSLWLPMPQRSMFFKEQTAAAVGAQQPEEPVMDEATKGTRIDVDGKVDVTGHTSKSKASVEEMKGQDEMGPEPEEFTKTVGPDNCTKVLVHLWRDFRQCYSSRQLLYWSVWWAMATCGYNLIINYVQVLWDHVQPSQDFSIYNGGVEAVSYLMSAATAYGIGFTEVRWEHWGELALGSFSGLGAAALFLMTFIGNIWVCYAGYIIFKCLYMLLITIAMYQIAADLSLERYALVFGANNFGALALQAIITSVVVDSSGLGLAIIPQFIIYASYFSVIAVVFLLRGLFTIWTAKKYKTENPPDNTVSPGFEEHRF
ncbi:Thiamine transporter 2 [Channa argus]|uniref:Thiamine transporter 2 n=1 Tax=Channa argus TaxID=215402 RepID=A0A6G1PSG2_CHAAH|nr:Thiamine transporter 2 [Channa argus]